MTPFCALSTVCLDCGSERCCSRSFISGAQISAGLFLGSRLFTLERGREGQCQNSRAGTISLHLKSLDSIQSPKRDVCVLPGHWKTQFLSLSLSHLLNPCETVSPDERHIVRTEPNCCRHIWPVGADRLPRALVWDKRSFHNTLKSLQLCWHVSAIFAIQRNCLRIFFRAGEKNRRKIK